MIGNPLGKSGGSLIQQALIFGLGSLAVATPYAPPPPLEPSATRRSRNYPHMPLSLKHPSACSRRYLAAILAVIVAVWIRSARALNLQFLDAMEAAGKEA